ncbi:DUF2079 domain-containing protein [Candidatus Bathyarchaeota archaeon A05DMB-5]|nr:DUF2079 domain-containing protein [Candidatus Bathyarchaeota archaeon A05DMB-5]
MTTAWDLGIYEQSIWSTANAGKFFWYTVELPINSGGCFFGIHFSPVLFLVVPIYKIFQSTASLLVLQSFVIASGAVPLYLIGLKETGNQKYAFFFSFLYLMYPPMWGVNVFDFHTQAFLPVFFFFAFYYLSNKKFLKYFLFIILALSVVEFVPFIVIFFGLYGFWVERKTIKQSIRTFNYQLLLNKTVVASILTIILGISWYVIARTVIFLCNPTVFPNRNWIQFGDPLHNPVALLWNVISNPLRTIQMILPTLEEKVIYLFGLLAPVGLLSLLDIPSLLIASPWFLAALLSNYAPYYTAIGCQYVAFAAPFVFISAVRGGKRLFVLKDKFSSFHLSFGGAGKKMLIVFYVVILLVSYVVLFYQPHVDLLASKTVKRSFNHFTALNRILELVPPDASIMTQNDIHPHLSQRVYAYAMWEPTLWIYASYASASNISVVDFFLQKASVDYVLIDAMSEWYLENIEEYSLRLIENGSYGIYASADYVWLLKREYADDSVRLFDGGFDVDLYNQGLLMTVFNGSFTDGVPLFNETVLNVTVSPVLFEKLNPHRDSSELNVVWDGWLFIPVGGEYSFYVVSNSSNYRKLSIDNKVIFDCHDSSSKLALENGFHTIRFEYNVTDDNESLFLFWKPPWETAPKILSSDFLYLDSIPTVSSVVFAPSFNFRHMSPFPTINKDYFSSFINGYFNVESSGTCMFKVVADNCTMIYVDDKLVYNSHVSDSDFFSVELTAGEHKISVFYAELDGDASLELMWLPPGKFVFEEFY